MRRAIDSARGCVLYSLRNAAVEPLFAKIRHHKRVSRFPLRGETKVSTRSQVYRLAYNIEKIAKRAMLANWLPPCGGTARPVAPHRGALTCSAGSGFNSNYAARRTLNMNRLSTSPRAIAVSRFEPRDSAQSRLPSWGSLMRVLEPVEILYLSLMRRWERSAPADKHQGLLDGEPVRNTQTARLKYVLEKVALGNQTTTERVYSTLARHTHRQDGESYISNKSDWMQQPEALSGGWYFESCTSLEQKLNVVSALSHVGLSGPFVQAIAEFVSNKPTDQFFPTEADEPEVDRRIRAWEARNEG